MKKILLFSLLAFMTISCLGGLPSTYPHYQSALVVSNSSRNYQSSESSWVKYVDSLIAVQNQASVVHDTVFTVIHPNSTDSAVVVSIIDGVLTVASIYEPTGLLANFKNLISGAVVGLILFFWRRRELRKMKARGLLTDDSYI